MNDLERAAIAYVQAYVSAKAKLRDWEYAPELQHLEKAAHAYVASLQDTKPGLDPTPAALAREVLEFDWTDLDREELAERTEGWNEIYRAQVIKACDAVHALAHAVLGREERIKIAGCSCFEIQLKDPRRHFKGCALREPLPETDQVSIRCEHCQTSDHSTETHGLLADLPRGLGDRVEVALAEAYARGRVDGVEAEKKASVALYESREEWAKKASDFERWCGEARDGVTWWVGTVTKIERSVCSACQPKIQPIIDRRAGRK